MTARRNWRRSVRDSWPAVAALSALTACGAPGDGMPRPDGVPEAAEDIDTLTILTAGNERILAPWFSMSFDHLVFLTLFDIDERGQIRGKLARDWEAHPDGRTWTYHLRTDVRWQDGVPVTAHDVKFTYDLLTHPEVLFWNPSAQSVTVLDDSTFTITFRDAGGWPGPLEWWAVYYPKHLLEDLEPGEFRRWEFWTHPVGNGPYRVATSVPHTMLELEANSDHYRGRPSIDRVILRFGSSNTRVELMAGNGDVAGIFGLMSPGDAFDLASRDARYTVYASPSPSFTWLHWNLDHPILGDRNVRLALSLAIDPHEIAAVLDYPSGMPLEAYADPFRVDLSAQPAAFGPIPHDPARAVRLLDEAGWRDENGDGLLERDGQPLRFEVLSADDRVPVAIQAQLRRIGVQVDISTLSQPVISGRVVSGDYDACINSLKVDQAGGGDMMNYLADPTVHPGRHSMATLRDPELRQLATTLDTVVAPEARSRLRQRIWDLLLQELPATPILPTLGVTVAHRRVRGLSAPWRLFATTHMDELWIDENWTGEGAER